MNDSELDPRLNRWLMERDPGTVPDPLRARARRVPYDTPVPVVWRVGGALARPARFADGPVGPVAVAILVTGLLAAMVAAALLAGSRQPTPVLGVERWGDFVVGSAAPPIVMRARAGIAIDGDDNSVEFEDFAGSVVVVLAPASDTPGVASAQLAMLAAARGEAGAGAVFLVAARSASDLAGVVDTRAPTSMAMGAVDLPPVGSNTAFPDGGSALLVIDRHGTVISAFAGSLPGSQQLASLVRQLEVDR